MSEWQPIATAPMGEWILLRGGHDPEAAREIDISDGDIAPEDVARPVVGKGRMVDVRPDLRITAWNIAFWDSGWRSSYEDPKEWMRVPA